MNKKGIAVVAAMVMFGVGQAHAFDWFGGRLSIGGGYGRAKPKLPYSFQDQYQDGEMWTAHMKYFLNNDISVVASYADLEPYKRGNRNDNYRFRPIVGSLRYNLFHHLPISPYITGGAGYSTNRHEVPGQVATKWDGFTYQAGVGFEFFVTEGTSLGAEALYHYFKADGNNSPYRPISLVGTLNVYFGPGPSARRTEEALRKEKEEADRALADANAAKAAALQAQQQTLTAQQGQNAALNQASAAQQGQQAAEAAAAQAKAAADAANAKIAQMEAQKQQAQAELDNIKAMIARKDLNPITFKTGSAELLATSNPTLDKVAEAAKKYPDLKLRVEGHTDNVGGEVYNVSLSQRRADAVKNYLTSQGGVSAAQVTSIGVGKAGPVADNATAEGRSQNRRVEFITYIQ